MQTEVCRLSDKVTNRSFPFLNGLNGLAHLCQYLYVRSKGRRESKNQGAQNLSPKKRREGLMLKCKCLTSGPTAEVGKVTLKSNGDEALNEEFLLKSNGDEALNNVFL